MEIMTPERVLGEPEPPINWHHGTCDLCKRMLILVCHFGYNTQPHSYRLCQRCMAENIRYILYGDEAFEKGMTPEERDELAHAADYPGLKRKLDRIVAKRAR